jgi:hypothetical protein
MTTRKRDEDATLADLPPIPRADLEYAYRRGCHQTTACLRGLLGRCHTVADVAELLLVAQDVLREMRSQMKKDIPLLLDRASEEILRRLKGAFK